jgi:hypothetical protein
LAVLDQYAAFVGHNRHANQLGVERGLHWRGSCQQPICGGAFTSAIWANDGDNFAFANAQINAPHKSAIVTPDTSILKID